jgi:hypothetical protein
MHRRPSLNNTWCNSLLLVYYSITINWNSAVGLLVFSVLNTYVKFHMEWMSFTLKFIKNMKGQYIPTVELVDFATLLFFFG